MRKSSLPLLGLAVVLAVLIAGLALFWHPEPPARPQPDNAAPPGGAFTLQGADGPVALEDFRGKWVLLYFGYTYCPDVCPTALISLAEALKQLRPEEAARVAVLFVSVDPERDSPAHLKTYLAFFHPAMQGLTGSPAEVAEVAGRYGVRYARQPADAAGHYAVDHSSETHVLGPEGQWLGRLAHGTPPEAVVAELRRHLH